MTHTPVESSNIHSLGHENNVLEVRFKCGPCYGRGSVTIDGEPQTCPKCKGAGHNGYRYHGVPAEIHARVLAGEPAGPNEKPSVGKAFNRLVRANQAFRMERIP